MEPVLYLIAIPVVFGIFCYVMPPKIKGPGVIAFFLGALVPFLYAYKILYNATEIATEYFLIDNLSRFILFFCNFFGILIMLYSVSFMANNDRRSRFYAYTLWTIAGASGAVIANNLILLLVFWGFIGLTLYLMIGISGASSADVSKKTFIIVGGSDAFLIMGIAILWTLSGSYRIDQISLNLNTLPGWLPTIAFLCLLVAAFAKAGAMPFHTWIPDCAEKAPIPATALLPASLDKLLGIYLLARASMNLFVVSEAMQFIMLFIGALTIVVASFMALIQKDIKRLLGFCAVSQVGYIVLGISSGSPVGIAGGLFHMLNHAIYKSCLFLCGGAVEKRTGTTDLNKLGGLARFMPFTFTTFIIAALAVSGVPPLNGFMSKWMVYQGLINLGKDGHPFWIIWLVSALFGSALTLAYMMKLFHAVFLGQRSKEISEKKITEVSLLMWGPMVVLAILCILFGVFAQQSGLGLFITPVVPGIRFLGFWEPVLATLLIMIGLFVGAIVYFLGRPSAVRESETYVGGEILEKGLEVSGVEFYKTIQDMGFFKRIYKLSEKKMFDVYELGKDFIFSLSGIFQRLHTGVLPTYLLWALVGMLILILALCKGGL